MANFDKTIDENGQEWMELCGKLHPCRTLKEPHEMFTDGVEGMRRFQEHMKEVREDYHRREHASWLATRDIVLR